MLLVTLKSMTLFPRVIRQDAIVKGGTQKTFASCEISQTRATVVASATVGSAPVDETTRFQIGTIRPIRVDHTDFFQVAIKAHCQLWLSPDQRQTSG
jgi:hypothetical protein